MEKILIVDDNPTDRFIQEKMLENQYEVKVAATPNEGAAIINEWQPDIIVVDYAMPEMNGIQAIRMYKEKMNYDGIYLILTGLDDINIATEAVRSGAYDYLVKPLVATIFNHKIKNCMNYRKLVQAEKEKVASAVVERIILSIYYEIKPIYDNLKNVLGKLSLEPERLNILKENIDNLGKSISKLENLDNSTKQEYVENILSYYVK